MSCRTDRGLRGGRRRRGFSLVEIMVVIVIIGLLAGVVTVNVRGYLIKAKQATARDEIRTIAGALESYNLTYGRVPGNDDGLAILTRQTPKLPEPLLMGVPVDPWGNDYQYNSPGSAGPYEVICHGGDGRPGGDGADADISSNNLKE